MDELVLIELIRESHIGGQERMRRSRRREELVKGSKPKESGGGSSQKAGARVLARTFVVDHNRTGSVKGLI